MDHQNNYESETFGFINAFNAAENFPSSQDEVKTENLRHLSPSNYDVTENTPSNTYNEPISTHPVESINDQRHDELITNHGSEVKDSGHLDTQSLEANQPTTQLNPDQPENESESTSEPTNNGNSAINIEPTSESNSSDAKPMKKDATGKKRRRIMLLNDDDDSENELKKELLEKLSDTEQQPEEKSVEANLADNEAEAESDIDLNAGTVNKNILKAKYLLKSAVVIGPEKKKKKKPRVLDSDDESDQLMNTSVDDIGLINDNNCENQEEEEILTDNIVILNDNLYDIPEDNSADPAPSDANKNVLENAENDSEQTETLCQTNINEKKNDDQEEAKETPPKQEKDETTSKNDEDVDAVLDKIQPMDDDDDFFKFNDSTDDDEVKNTVTNEEYFGSPDKPTVPGKKRGPKPGTRRRTTQKSGTRKRGDRYEGDFVDDSESSSYSDSISSSSSSSESSTERIPRRKPGPSSIMKQVQRPVPIVQRPVTLTIPKIPMSVKQDRFYDKSRNIPNDVYFGDVKVPLHVLHSRWNTDEETRRLKRLAAANRPVQRAVSAPIANVRPLIQNIRPQMQPHIQPQVSDDRKLTVLKEFISHCGIKLNYPKLFSGVKSNSHKCILLRRILAQKGMEGEPTLAKCKKLKRELQAKRESAELDKSLILNTEGRTRRSRRGISAKDSEESMGASNNETDTPAIQPEVLQTLSKIKSVIDSDSE